MNKKDFKEFCKKHSIKPITDVELFNEAKRMIMKADDDQLRSLIHCIFIKLIKLERKVLLSKEEDPNEKTK